MQLKYFTYGGGCDNANQNNGAYRLLISLNSGNTGWTVGSWYLDPKTIDQIEHWLRSQGPWERG